MLVALGLFFPAAASALTHYELTNLIAGSGPTALSNPTDLAVDQSNGDLYVANSPTSEQQVITLSAATGTGNLTKASNEITGLSTTTGAFAVGEPIEAPGIPAGTEISAVEEDKLEISQAAEATATAVVLTAEPTGGTYTLTFKGQTTTAIPFNASGSVVNHALQDLSTIGEGAVAVTHQSGGRYLVDFQGPLAFSAQAQITADASGLAPAGTSSVEITTSHPGSSAADVEKFTPSGEFILMIGKEVDKTAVEAPHASEAEQDLCTAASHDTCQAGTAGSSPGAFAAGGTERLFLAVDSSPGGEGDLYVGDTADHLVSKFEPSGTLIAGWGNNGPGASADGQLTGFGSIAGVAVDLNGDLFVSEQAGFFSKSTPVYHYGPGGALIHEFNSEGATAPAGLAVDAEDHLYKLGGEAIVKFNSTLGEALSLETEGRNGNTEDPTGLAIAPSTNDLYFVEKGERVQQLGLNCGERCPLLETFGEETLRGAQGVAVAAEGAVYVADTGDHRVAVFNSYSVPELSAAPKDLSETSAMLTGHVVPAAGEEVTTCHFDYGTDTSYGLGPRPCLNAAGEEVGTPTHPITESTEVHVDLTGLTPATSTYHFRLVAGNSKAADRSSDQTFLIPLEPPAVGAESISAVYAETATVHAQVQAEGDTSYYVEYATQGQFEGHEEEFEEGGLAGAAKSPSLEAASLETPRDLTAQLSGLVPDTTYHYRVVAANFFFETTGGATHTFTTLPFIKGYNETCPNAHVRQQTSSAGLLDCRAYELVSAANSGGYDVESNLISGQSPFAGYPEAQGRVLYGVHDGGIPGTGDATNRGVDPYLAIRGTQGWTTEYVGIPANVDSNSPPFSSTLAEADSGLDTFAFAGQSLCAPCFSKGIETGIPLHLPDDELIQGMAGSEEPGPTTKPDGYIASYFSANGEDFIFGSASKFTAAGNSSGPVSIYERNLKTGDTNVVSNSSEVAGQPLPCLQDTAEGECHGPNDSNGIAELAISANGTHVLVAQKVSEDTDHNVSWHLYMNVGDSAKTIALTPGATGTTGGVLFDGMTGDGSEVFFSSEEHLTHEDEEHSGPSLYMWSEAGEKAGHSLTLISKGENEVSGDPGDTESCEPVSNAHGEHWNTVGSANSCGIVAVGGGGGVATEAGSIYFLSPERLSPPKASCGIPCSGEEPVLNQPNLYLAAPGQPPVFVATLSPEDPLVLDAVKEAGTRHAADFQLTASGEYAVFTTTRPLNTFENSGHSEIYRYNAPTEKLDCVSCDPTNAEATGNASLATAGQSLTDAGQVFFNTPEALAAADTDEKQDVYEWEPQGTGNCETSSASFAKTDGDCLALISSGTSSFNSGLVGVDANGKDAYFFTRDSLVPQDKNGPTMKIYDARLEGGFPYVFPEVQCKASDECHGPSSAAPGPIEAGTEAGTPHNYVQGPKPKTCKPGFVLEHGKCVKKPHHHKRKRHRRRAARRSHRARSSVVLRARGRSRAFVASKQSKSGSSAPRAKMKHLQLANHKRGGSK